MFRFRKMLLFAAMTAAAVLLGPPSARADFEVEFTFGGATILVDATTQTVTSSGGASTAGASFNFSAGTVSINNLTISPTGATGGFKISATIADSNSPGGKVATIDTSSLSILNQTGTAGNSTLVLTTGDTGFTSPSGPSVGLTSTISATAAGTNSANASVLFNSYLDTTNAQFGTQQGTPTILLSPLSPGSSLSGDTSAALTGTPSPYSLTEVAKITLANGDKLTDLSSGTTVVPAPAGLALALTGLPLLGLGGWLRRRKQA